MEKYILKSNGNFLHFEHSGIVEWHNINPEALCAFDTIEEAKEIINECGLQNTIIIAENFSETFFA